MTVIRNFGVAGVASTIEFGKQGGTLNYNNTTKVFSFALSTALTIPSGNNAQRPSTGTLGMLRVNTETVPFLELYDGTDWRPANSGGGTGSGAVSSVSIVTANGFTGTVANPFTTPAITLGTTVNGLVKGVSGTLVSASTATDYQVPILLTNLGPYGPATFDGRTLNIPTAATGVTQIIAGSNVTLSSSGPDGTGAVTVSVGTVAVSNLSGGDVNQIPYQTSSSTTAFSPKFTWNNLSNTLGLGENASTAVLSGVNAASSFAAASLVIKGGNATALGAPGSLTLSGGNGLGGAFRGADVTIQGGVGGALGSGDIILKTSSTGAPIDRLRILRSGAWSVGTNDTFTGNSGQVLTSQGPDSPPTWQNVNFASGVTQILAGNGITLDPAGGTGIVRIIATGGGGGGSPGGMNGQLQFNNGGVFDGTPQIVYSNTNTLTVGAANTTFTIVGVSGSSSRGSNILIKSGNQVTGGTDTRVTIAGGDSQDSTVQGGSVYLDGGLGVGTAQSSGGTIYLRTTTATSLVERLQVSPTGAIGLSGPNYGSVGQVLTSQGPNSPPIWMAGGGGGGGSGVTLVNVSGGTTGLTTVGGPITSTGTITLTGTLAIAHGGTGLTAVPGENGSLFFNNNNTFEQIPGMKFDGSNNLYINTINITTEDNFDAFGTTFPITIKPGTSRNNSGFSANATFAGGDNFSTINRAGHAIISGGTNSTPARSGFVILRTNNTDRLIINETGALGVPGQFGPNYGTENQVLVSQGANLPPIWRSGGGTGTGGVTSVAASPPLASSGGTEPIISLSTVNPINGGTGYTNYTFGDMLWASGATTFTRLNIGGNGQILSVINGRPQWASSAAGVQSFSAGNTGLTPSTATGGNITLAGRLAVGFGGTGANNKFDGFNALAPTTATGDLIYRDSTGNVALPIGVESNVLQVVSGLPAWAPSGLPQTAVGLRGRFLATEGTTGTHATWSSQILFSGGNASDQTRGRNITVQAVDGDPNVAAAGGNVFIRGGNNSELGGAGGGNVQIQLGRDASTGNFTIRNFSEEIFRVSRIGALSFGPTGTNNGTSGQILSSQGAGGPPTWINLPSGLPTQTGNSGSFLTTNGTTASWTAAVSKIVAGNSNIIVSPATGTGVVTLSVVGAGFQGVTSFSAGNTGFTPQSSTSGDIVLTGTLLITSGGTGLTSYAAGDILYASASTTTLAKLSIGAANQILTSNGVAPTWTNLTGLPAQNSSTRGYFLSSEGTSGASWNPQVYWSPGISGNLSGRNLSLIATDGDTSFSGYSGGSVFIRAGDAGGANGGGGIIDLQLGFDPSAGYFRVRTSSSEFFRITRSGSWSLGDGGTNVGTTGQVLTSQGPNLPPSWTSAGNGLPEQAGYSGYFLTTNGETASWAVVSGGSGAPGGSTGQLQWNNGGAFAGTNQISYNASNILTLGAQNTFTIVGANSTADSVPGTTITIKGGQSGATTTSPTGSAGDVRVQGGDGKTAGTPGIGGAVYLIGGTGSTATQSGFVAISTGASSVERVRFTSLGAWQLAGSAGSVGQAIISTGANSPPEWRNVVQSLVAGNNIVIAATGTTGTFSISATASPLSTATTTTLGGIKIGSGLSITADGTLSATGGGGGGAVSSVTGTNGVSTNTSTGAIVVSGTIATTSTVGVIKIGSGLQISADGTLSVVFPKESFELAFAMTGKAGNGTMFMYAAARAFTLPANLTGSRNTVLSPATVNTAMQIFRLTSAGVINNLGFIQFNANASSGIVTFANTATINVGDTLYGTISVSDTTLGDIAITIPGTLI